jgi:hypothetical protein
VQSLNNLSKVRLSPTAEPESLLQILTWEGKGPNRSGESRVGEPGIVRELETDLMMT